MVEIVMRSGELNERVEGGNAPCGALSCMCGRAGLMSGAVVGELTCRGQAL